MFKTFAIAMAVTAVEAASNWGSIYPNPAAGYARNYGYNKPEPVEEDPMADYYANSYARRSSPYGAAAYGRSVGYVAPDEDMEGQLYGRAYGRQVSPYGAAAYGRNYGYNVPKEAEPAPEEPKPVYGYRRPF